MEGQQARKRFGRLASYGSAATLTLFGLALIVTALRHPFSPSPSPDPPRITQAPSARGLGRAGRLEPTQAEGPVAALLLEQPTASPQPSLTAELPVARLGTGGPSADPLPPDTQVLAAPTGTPAPTETPPRTEVIVYKVARGDNVWLISQRFGISQDTVIWANGALELDADLLSIDQELYILPVSGAWHTVKAGETLEGIAKYYQVEPQKILDYAPNKLAAGQALSAGQKLIIPDGIKPFEAHVVFTEGGAVTVNARPEPGRLIWPCNGVITQPFDPRYHLAIDIGNNEGTPLYAADAGTVTLAEAAGTLGNAVRIDHGNGYTTIYGHLSVIMVQSGQYVQRGQQIGLMGSTGKSTGPHLHLIVIYCGGAVNPIRYLPPTS